MDDMILSALKAIDVAAVPRSDWIAVGMALKEEGFPLEVWDEWSRNDSRYKPGECERIWNGFHGYPNPVRGGTIVKLARQRGWSPSGGGAGYDDGTGELDWDDEIFWEVRVPASSGGESSGGEAPGEGTSGSGEGFAALPGESGQPAQDLITYLETLFDPDEKVAYVTGDVWKNEEGRWAPGRGVYCFTAGELISSLRSHPEDVGATMGDWKPEAGAWIRFNPVDGKGVRNQNVTRFHYALVESDTLPVEEQYSLYRRLELPIACLVHSGGKSLHAIVHVDADNAMEYRRRVNFLYDYLEKNGVSIDRQNSNPSRLSRMPGVTRNGKRQYLVATNIGRKNWQDWLDFTRGDADQLPAVAVLSDYVGNPPPLPEELIEGVLRRGHKMLISGSSKAGKSFLLMELCIAIAEGRPWLGFNCKKGRVLYINLEIDPASA
ncbi:MAG: PriCT-2 domain-containing protein, partial [Oscillospiraceae bacterium]|nr:PriCT-2 domain-containing protein [Oscillospiraceae bacterium]